MQVNSFIQTGFFLFKPLASCLKPHIFWDSILFLFTLSQSLTDMRYCSMKKWPKFHLSRGKL